MRPKPMTSSPYNSNARQLLFATPRSATRPAVDTSQTSLQNQYRTDVTSRVYPFSSNKENIPVEEEFVTPRSTVRRSLQTPLQAMNRHDLTPRVHVQIVPEEEIPVEQEQEVQPGNVYTRPEFNFHAPYENAPPVAATLYDCISNGSLDLNKAARLILQQKRSGQFNQSIYDEFVHSECASRVHRFATDGLLDLNDVVLEMRLNNIANFLLSEIQIAKMDRYTRTHEIMARGTPEKKPIISVQNLTRAWSIEGPLPFIKVSLEELVLNFHSNPKHNTFQQFAALYRFLLMRLTDPPDRIQEYAVRLNGKVGRNGSLHGLPPQIENTLLDFGEDLIGYGHNELRSGAIVNAANSSFFLQLGNNHEERNHALQKLIEERILFRSELFKGLQLALRDIRSYEYEGEKRRWKASNRKAKRTLAEDVEDSSPQESPPPTYQSL